MREEVDNRNNVRGSIIRVFSGTGDIRVVGCSNLNESSGGVWE